MEVIAPRGLRFCSAFICCPFQPVAECGVPIRFAALAAVSVLGPIPHPFQLVPRFLAGEAKFVGKLPSAGIRLPIVWKCSRPRLGCFEGWGDYRGDRGCRGKGGNKGGNQFCGFCGILRNSRLASSLACAIRCAPPLCLLVNLTHVCNGGCNATNQIGVSPGPHQVSDKLCNSAHSNHMP